MSTDVVPAPGLVDQLYAELEQKIHALRPKEDLTLLEKAFHRAADAHQGQMRESGEPYMIHPLHVTMILADMQMDMVCLMTGLLHDTVEDTSLSLEQIKKEFGPEVAACVDGVTKLSKLKLYSREERQAESVRKMLLAMVNDIRVIIVKLADRLHNMRTLDALPRERQLRISQETAEIYAPIAHRLGMGKVRGELEDLSFRYLEPDAWAELMREIESQRLLNEEYLTKMRHDVEVNLRRENIPARVEARIKRPYSVFQKMKRQKIALDQVYDLLALRIITDSVKNCYAALGVIHNEWHPIPGRIKDFIAIPRPNLYQSLHTSVIGPGGRSFEVCAHRKRHRSIRFDGADTVDARDRGDNDDVVALEQRAGRSVPHTVDLLVDRRFFLDVRVRARHIRLGLVVVVIRDEVLDSVFREEALELAVELGRERLVWREDERRTLGLFDYVRHCESLAGARHAKQHLILLVLAHAFDEFGDGLRLVAFGFELGRDFKSNAAFAFLRTLRPMRDERRHAARDDRVGCHQRLAGKKLLGALGTFCRFG